MRTHETRSDKESQEEYILNGSPDGSQSFHREI